MNKISVKRITEDIFLFLGGIVNKCNQNQGLDTIIFRHYFSIFFCFFKKVTRRDQQPGKQLIIERTTQANSFTKRYPPATGDIRALD